MTFDLGAALSAKLVEAWPPDAWADVTVLVAVSGGADSVALVRGLAQVRAAGEGRLVLAHYNHRLRGDESDADEAFVMALAAGLGCPIAVSRAEQAGNLTSEAAMREARYAFLAAAAGQWGARYIATAHTADDQVETVLHNILRGTGLAGLAGIPRRRVVSETTTILRPLLGVTRAEVLAYLQTIGQAFREDASNASDDYTRNRIRRQLLPMLETQYNEHVRGAIVRLARIAGEANEVLDEQARDLLLKSSKCVPGEIELTLALLRETHPGLVRHALLLAWKTQHWPLQDMTMERWEQLLDWALNPSGPDERSNVQLLPGNIRAERRQATVRLIKG